MSIITLHGLDNQPIKILSSYIKKLIPIDNHAYFPELKTQVILEPGISICTERDNWIYVRETPEKIKNLISKAIEKTLMI